MFFALPHAIVISQLPFSAIQAAISVRIRAGLTGTEFALLSGLCAASGATNRQGLFQFGCHGYIMLRQSATSCSILISSFISASLILCFCRA